MTTVPSPPTDINSSCLSQDPVRRPIDQRYFLGTPDDAMAKPLPHIYTSDYPSPVTSSAASSSPSSPNLATTAPQQFPPTPTGSISFNDPDDQDELLLPSYDTAFFQEEPSTPTDVSVDSSVNSLQSTQQVPAADDASVEEEPSRHVDYLSHEWKEEDIWTSWRYVVARREVFENSVRLENASWRTWAKLKGNMGTVSPEALNWLKDCDVTWLYGPLKTFQTRERAPNGSPPPSYLESPSFCTDRKSILKKRTASETILQRSLSQHTLLQHAGAILKAQEAESRNRSGFSIHMSDFQHNSHTSGLSTPRARFVTKAPSSAAGSPGGKRHIHFNKEVLQCIAVDAKEEEEEEWLEFGGDSCWDDSYIVKPASPSGGTTPRGNSNGENNKTIAPLPPTTLKYRGETPEPQPPASASRWSWAKYFPRPSLYPSSLVETLRQRPRSSSAPTSSECDSASSYNWDSSRDVDDTNRSWFVDSAEDDEAAQNLYLASLGFPSHVDERPPNGAVLIDRVMDTVNTAKDIAHVIWNVGWRG